MILSWAEVPGKLAVKWKLETDINQGVFSL